MDDNTIAIDGEVFPIGKIQQAIVEYLYERPGENVRSRTLRQIAIHAGASPTSDNIVRESLRGLEETSGRKLFRLEGGSKRSTWVLDRFV